MSKDVEPSPVSKSLDATTTEQEDLTTAGQRRINLIWEYTQAFIAGVVVLSNMIVATWQGLVPTPPGTVYVYPVILTSSLFLVVGFYFSRTNHAAIGGIGVKPAQEYQGR